MMKKAINLLKKMGNAYINGMMEFYKPAVKYGINPFI